jgi:hypothetical protein
MSARFMTIIQPKNIFVALTLSSIEVFMAVLAVLSGVPITIGVLLNNPALLPPSINALAWTVQLAWGLALTVGGTLMTRGIAFREIRLERGGAILTGSSAFVLSVAILFSGTASIIGILTFGLFAWAMLARFYVLGRYLKEIEHLKRTLHPDKAAKREQVFLRRR